MGYLGKISAIVTANPLNFQKGLSDAADSARLFGKTVKSNIQSSMRDSERSFDGIMTKAQKLKASLDAAVANKIKFVGFAELDADIAPAVTRVKELADAANSIAKPLSGAAAKLSGMSQAIQAGFLPALSAAQQKALDLSNEINAGKPISDAYFKQVATQASMAAEAVDRIVEAVQLANQAQVSKKSLAYVDPASEDALQRVLSLQNKAAAAPVYLRMGKSFRAAQDDVENLANKLTVLIAKQEAAGNKPSASLRNEMLATRTAIDAALGSLSGMMSKEEASVAASNAAAKAHDLMAEAIDKAALAMSGPVADPFAERIKSVEKLRAALLSLPESHPMRIDGLETLEDGSRLKTQEAAALRGRTITPDDARGTAVADAAVFDAMTAAAKVEKTALKDVEDETKRLAKGFYAAAEAARAFPSDPFAAQTKAVERYKAAVMALADSDPRKAAAMSGLDAINARVNLAGQRADSGALPKDRAEALAGRSTASLNAGADRLKDNGLGKAMTDASRQSDVLKGKINSLKGQLDQLDDPIRSTMIPAIEQMEAHFRSGLPDAINASVANAQQLERTMARVQKAGTIKNSGAIIDDAAITRSMGRLAGMEQVLLRVGAAAGSDTALAFDRLANATRTAVQAGTLGLPDTIRLLNTLEKEAAEAAAATRLITVGGAMADINRGGDVGRTGMNKFSMGLNQAMFAVDDFFSSVGGIEQKIRAVSNNITQLGFVVGNAKGLFVSLAAVITAQVGLALYKYINDGRSAEDVTKALNDALARQKSLLESLAQAYDSLAESIGKSGMSDRGQKEAERKKQFDDIRKKQKELRDEGFQSLDPTVNKERANQAKLQRDLETEGTAGGRVLIEQKIKESKDREEQRKKELQNSPTPTVDAARNAVKNALNRGMVAEPEDIVMGEERNREFANAVIQQDATIKQQIAGLRNAQDKLRPQASSVAGEGAKQGIADLEAIIKALEKAGSAVKDEALAKVFESLQGVSDILNGGQEKLKAAFGEDVGMSNIAAFMDKLDKELEVAAKLAKDNPDDAGIQADVENLRMVNEILALSLNEASSQMLIFSDVIKRVSGSLESDLGSFQQIADKAREEDIRLGTPETAGLRKVADDNLRNAEEKKKSLENDLEHARNKYEEDLVGQNLKGVIKSLEDEIANPETTADRRRVAQDELEKEKNAQRNAMENDPNVKKAKQGIDDYTKEQQQVNAAVRGREAAMTGEEKRAADLKSKADDLAAASAEAEKAQAGSGQALAQKGAEQMAIAAAPMLAGFRDEVMNARLQGPSRQALKVSDTTTSEGQAELQRLLRGDDAAKDINLVELRQQTASLREIERLLKDEHNIVVDL